MGITFTVGNDLKAHDLVTHGLHDFNLKRLGRSFGPADFELYARDEAGKVVGGMLGHPASWLYIDYLWLQDDQRGSGLGSQLIALAEDEARRRGCIGLFLYTYSFQAPGFYEKQGFERMGVLEDCPPGHQRIYLKKHLG
jgi:GNAT superfamily N-acetyltransferase